MLKRDIMVGSMLWVTPGESSEEMAEDVQGMLDCGLVIARLFMGGVETEEDVWDFDIWDRLIRIAEEKGLLLTPTLNSIGTPDWIARRFAGMIPTVEQYDYIHKHILLAIEKTVERYKDSPAIHSWILQNEPAYYEMPVTNCTLRQFREWLLEKYEYDLEALKVRSEASIYQKCLLTPRRRQLTESEKAEIREKYQPIAQRIGQLLNDGTAVLEGVTTASGMYVNRVDWAAFTTHLLDKHLRQAAAVVKAIDPVHPTTINPEGVGSFSPTTGRNTYTLAKTVDFLGHTNHAAWHSPRYPLDRIHQSVAMFCDCTRSATCDPDGYFWITELQAGTNYFSGVRPMMPKPDDITHWLWEAVATGCRGMIYWLYKSRDAGYEGLEWGLLNQKRQPSRRAHASKVVSDLLYSRRELFNQAWPKEYDGYILQSYDSFVLGENDRRSLGPRPGGKEDPINDKMVQDAFGGAHMILQDMGLDAGFVWEYEIHEKARKAPFLIAPNCYGLQPSVVDSLIGYVREGGVLIADGLFGVKDPYGYSSQPDMNAKIACLFGDCIEDWGVYTRPLEFRAEDGSVVPAWYLDANWEEQEGMQVLARDEDGYASVICHPLGKGCAIAIGTQFFQNYFAHAGVEGAREFLWKLLPALDRPFTLENPGKLMRMKLLQGKTTDILFLLSREEGKARAVVTSNRGRKRFRDLQTGEEFVLDAATAVPMEKMQVRVLEEIRN